MAGVCFLNEIHMEHYLKSEIISSCYDNSESLDIWYPSIE